MLDSDAQLVEEVIWIGKPSVLGIQYPDWLMEVIFAGWFWYDEPDVLMCNDFAITPGDVFGIDIYGEIYINYWRLAP
jgi:hypothetical protein